MDSQWHHTLRCACLFVLGEEAFELFGRQFRWEGLFAPVVCVDEKTHGLHRSILEQAAKAAASA
jgi:hypothetical protein